MSKTKPTLVQLTPEIIEQLDIICEKTQMNRSQLIRLILEQGIKEIKAKGLQLKLF